MEKTQIFRRINFTFGCWVCVANWPNIRTVPLPLNDAINFFNVNIFNQSFLIPLSIISVSLYDCARFFIPNLWPVRIFFQFDWNYSFRWYVPPCNFNENYVFSVGFSQSISVSSKGNFYQYILKRKGIRGEEKKRPRSCSWKNMGLFGLEPSGCVCVCVEFKLERLRTDRNRSNACMMYPNPLNSLFSLSLPLSSSHVSSQSKNVESWGQVTTLPLGKFRTQIQWVVESHLALPYESFPTPFHIHTLNSLNKQRTKNNKSDQNFIFI